MESRMEKYYRENPEYYKRSKRNVNLYKDIDNDINDLENLPIPDNSNEIDINGLKQIISSRDEYRKAKDMGRTITRKRVEEEPREEKRRVYDINVLLETAKNEVNKNNEVEGKKLINANFLTDLDDDFFEEKSHTGVKVFFLIIGLLLLAGVIYLAITKYVL